jgi:replicative DNA helicase
MASNLPYNLEAEQALLGCVIIDNEIIVTLSDEMKIQDFFDRRHQLIFQAMLNLYRGQMQIDFTTLIAELQMKNQLVEAGGAVYLSSLLDAEFTTANVGDYIQIVQDSALKRNVIAAATSIGDAGYNANYDAASYVDYAERLISDLTKRRRTEGFTSISTVLENVKNIMIANRNRTDEITGLSTGFNNLDEITLGLQKDNLIILAARPAMGKSAFAMNIAVQAAQKNKKENGEPISVAVFSLEMSQEQIAQRMTASQAHVNLTNIQKGSLNQKEMLLIEGANDDLSNLNLYFCDQGSLTIADIRAKCRKQQQTSGLDLVVIDYLQLINGSGRSSSRQDEVSNISRSLKQMARELGVPVIALAQLSREVEKREDKRPIMADLRESGSIEQDADIIMFLYREDYYTKGTSKVSNLTELIIAKNRSGVTGTIQFIFQGEYQLFTSYVGN